MRRILGPVIGVVLLAGLTACHAAAAARAPSPAPTASCVKPALPPSMTSAAANSTGTAIPQPGGRGAITVAAIGFTQSLDGMLSIGAEVSNSGSRIAYDTSLVFQAFDPGHRALLDRQTVTIPVLLPGARVPVGLPSTSTADLAWAGYPRVRTVRATLIRTRWLPPTGEFPRVSVHLVPPLVNIGGERLVTEAVLAGNTNACTSEPATRAAILYRNHSDAIVGGAIATTADASGVIGFEGCVVGGFHGGVYAFGLQPKTADPSRTEVALYCDPGSTKLPTSRTMQ